MKTKQQGVKNFLELLAAVLLLVGLDQYTKFLAVKHLKDQADIALIPNVLYLQYLENRGAAFGIFQGQKWFLFIFDRSSTFGCFLCTVENAARKEILAFKRTLFFYCFWRTGKYD